MILNMATGRHYVDACEIKSVQLRACQSYVHVSAAPAGTDGAARQLSRLDLEAA